MKTRSTSSRASTFAHVAKHASRLAAYLWQERTPMSNLTRCTFASLRRLLLPPMLNCTLHSATVHQLQFTLLVNLLSISFHSIVLCVDLELGAGSVESFHPFKLSWITVVIIKSKRIGRCCRRTSPYRHFMHAF